MSQIQKSGSPIHFKSHIQRRPKSKQIKLSTQNYQNQPVQPTQTVKPVLGFTPEEFKEKQDNPEITDKDIQQIKPCKDYVETPLKTLDRVHVNQPQRFLPLTKEALKIAKALRKEQQAAQWAGIPLKNQSKSVSLNN